MWQQRTIAVMLRHTAEADTWEFFEANRWWRVIVPPTATKSQAMNYLRRYRAAGEKLSAFQVTAGIQVIPRTNGREFGEKDAG